MTDPTPPSPETPQSSSLPTPGQPTPPQSSEDHGIEWILWGRGGLRAGWGIAAFVLLFILFVIGIGIAMHALFHWKPTPGSFTVSSGLISEALQLSAVFLTTLVLALVERRSPFSYGLQGPSRAPRFLGGLVSGFAAISALVLVLWKAGYLVFDGQPLHGDAILTYGLGWGLVFLGTGFFEESLLRGYVQFTMTRGVGFWWGALLFSFLFGFIHSTNPGESPVGLFQAGFVGLVFCLSLWYTGSLWWAIGFHAAWDWGESYFYGTSDSGLIAHGHLFAEHPVGNILLSGGLTGPEGSLFGVPLLLLVALLMALWWGRRGPAAFAGQGWQPAWLREKRLAQAAGLEA
ncbi:CPBP family intramembrane glutamic endopeptidase [Silvibacterium dinghuense]|uniref:CPBP family intramembrane glutamic endopeptidase n=1 Tax=Silvibacterium dinghuense TaxID=1560006 RepID=UPI001E3CB4BF|nr:type II CAAX endopeptidase family protein [Silvibacterium dinghuense]